MTITEIHPGDIAGNVDWQERAVCQRTDPEAFFPEHHQPTVATPEVVGEIESMRPTRKWWVSRITFELPTDGIVVARRAVTKSLRNLELHRRRFIEPNGVNNDGAR
ncbi:hypothetical protein [Rhodococcus qingshengii]|uniref:hypothetical protein n=1 Tax=Rhodococcus qingshengii TaxID=334542 RepID=UPI00210AF3C7|nr:hypothetical protein [Rhodococcus qingshengii]MCQ4150574.1 hypothetical protein [Rhodococcus qingshengii]